MGPESIAEYASERQGDGLQIRPVNSCLRFLGRVLRRAEEWGVLTRAPRVKFLAGEHCRERVLNPQEEALYLSAALPPLHDVSAVLFDTGMRPKNAIGCAGACCLDQLKTWDNPRCVWQDEGGPQNVAET